MGVRIGSTFSNTIVASPALAAETVVCTLGPLNLAVDNAAVYLDWFVGLTIGTSGVTLTPKLVRGSITGLTAINNPLAYTVVAANKYLFSGCWVDTPGVVAGLIYSLTLTIGSGAAASTISELSLSAYVL